MNSANPEQQENLGSSSQNEEITLAPAIRGTPSPNKKGHNFGASPFKDQPEDQKDAFDDSLSAIEQRNNENMEANYQRIKDDLDSSIDSEQISSRMQQRLKDEHINEDDLNKLPHIELIDKFQKLRSILENNAIEAQTRNRILDQLAQIDKKLQSIEERELNKNFQGAYENYNLILRRYYEKQLKHKDGELQKLQNEIENREIERNKLADQLNREQEEVKVLRDEHTKSCKAFEDQSNQLIQNSEALRKDNENLKNSKLEIQNEKEALVQQKKSLEERLKKEEDNLSQERERFKQLEREFNDAKRSSDIAVNELRSLEEKEGQLDRIGSQLREALDELGSSKQLLEHYKSSEQNLQKELESTKEKLENIKKDLETTKADNKKEIDNLQQKLLQTQREAQELSRAEEQILKEKAEQDKIIQKEKDEIKRKEEENERLRKSLESKTEEVRKQKEDLLSHQTELKRLEEVEANLIKHKNEIKKLIEEKNFKREQLLKLVQDVASKSERFEEDRQKLDKDLQNKQNQLKEKKEEIKRKNRGSRDYDTLPVILGFIIGILITITGSWVYFHPSILSSLKIN